MKITVEIEIEREVWRQAIADGWNAAFCENLTGNDTGPLDNSGDFLRAIDFISEDQIKSIQIS